MSPRPIPSACAVTAPISGVGPARRVGGRRPVRVAPERVAQYVLHEPIARGGMAEVWRATGPDGREVALKRMLPALAGNPRAVLMFADEALLGMRLKHPRLVHTFELGTDDNEPFLVMELVRGPSVADILSRVGEPIKPAIAVHLIEQLLEGLIALHELADDDGTCFGLVHRDVSPNNMFLTFSGELKLGDFGIALGARDGAVQPSGPMQGKLGYMAPEQIAGDALDARADLFAAGVVLLELLLGRRAFATDHEVATLVANYSGVVPGIAAGVPEPLARVVRTAMAQRREARFPTARAFAEALAQAGATLGLESGHELLKDLLRGLGVSVHAEVRSTVRTVSTARRRADLRPTALPSGAGLKSCWAGRVAQSARALATGRVADFEASLAPGLDRRRELLAYRFGERDPGAAPISLLTPGSVRGALRHLTERQATGLLVARSEDREVRIFFHEGGPIFIASSNPKELLGERLVRAGYASTSEIDLAIEWASRCDCPLGEALVDLGIVSARIVFAEIREQMRERLRDLATWTEGELSFIEHARPGLCAVRLRPSDFDLDAA